MSLVPGARLGSYEVIALIGSGGMGEVYRARDTRLKREVAIKVLPDAFANDPDRLARFQREAELLATLNHPNIGAVYGFEQSDPSTGSGQASAIVLELVEGETLADRIHRGPIPVKTALGIAVQIAEALEAAHERGIIHRDLKPANIKITTDDKVKVLDFGLAKALDKSDVGRNFSSAGAPGQDPAYLSHSPTLSMMATQAGVILGTAAYMSPEQAKGFPADHRSDVFAFGVVLFEMLTGRQAFRGDMAPDVLAAVIVHDVDLNALPSNLPPRVHEVVRRCLNKNPKNRWQAIGDVRAEIEIATNEPASRQHQKKRTQPLRVVALIAGTALAASGMTAAVFRNSARPVPRDITRFVFTLPAGQQFTNTGRVLLAISPDGSRLAYVANLRIYLRHLDQLVPTPINGTENPNGGVTSPVFSPDGQSIAFWARTAVENNPSGSGVIKKVAVTGGAPITIATANNPLGMSWEGNSIVFVTTTAIMKVAAGGGPQEELVRLSDTEVAHGLQLLPGGRHLLFSVTDRGDMQWNSGKVVAVSLQTRERKVLISGGSSGRYVPTGHLVYTVGGVLLAAPFDLDSLQITGEALPVVEGVRRVNASGVIGAAQFDVAQNGTLVYAPGPAGIRADDDIVILDSNGSTTQLNLPPAGYFFPRVAPNGKLLTVERRQGDDAAILVHDLGATSAPRRLTFGGRNRFPIWTADSQRITFQSDREKDSGIFWQKADGSGQVERLTKSEPGTAHVPESWSPSGSHLLFSVIKGSAVSLWSFDVANRKAQPFGGITTTDHHIDAVFSPDGRWVAYASRDGERAVPTIFVQPFPATGTKYQVPYGYDPHHPLWSPDGKELYYVPGPQEFVAIAVSTLPTLSFGKPRAIPRGTLTYSGPGLTSTRTFDVLPDGRFVGSAARGSAEGGFAPEIHFIVNWFEELKQRVPLRD